MAGQAIPAPAIVIRSTGDKEKEITAKIGQAKFTLYNVGGVWDCLGGKVLNIAYSVWPKTRKDISAIACAPRAGQLSSLLSCAPIAKPEEKTRLVFFSPTLPYSLFQKWLPER